MKQKALVIILCSVLVLSGCRSAQPFLTRCHYTLPAANGNERLNRAVVVANNLLLHQKSNALWERGGWWNSANILEALIDFNRITNTDFKKCLNNLYLKNVFKYRGRFITGHAFDDNEWWALTWLKAYDMTGEKRYLLTAKGIFKDMVKRSWDDVQCNGGVRWASTVRYKNAVTNELFIELASRLALESKDLKEQQYYLNWALKDWHWFKASGMINAALMINDGLDTNCNNNNGFTWTYNQGIVLGALKDLFLLTLDSGFLYEAKALAYASMEHRSNKDGILTDPGDRKPGHDKNQFKGIYIRYLAALNAVLHDKQISDYILRNADFAWQHARNNDNQVDFYWAGPYKDWSSSAEGSALDLMNAAILQPN